MTKLLEQEFIISVDDTEAISVDFTPHLDSGELLASVDFAVVDGDNVTISNEAVSTAAYEDAHSGATVAIGKAAQCLVTSSSSGRKRLSVAITTDSTPARAVKRDLIITFG